MKIKTILWWWFCCKRKPIALSLFLNTFICGTKIIACQGWCQIDLFFFCDDCVKCVKGHTIKCCEKERRNIIIFQVQFSVLHNCLHCSIWFFCSRVQGLKYIIVIIRSCCIRPFPLDIPHFSFVVWVQGFISSLYGTIYISATRGPFVVRFLC